jgi:hypothetical protein
MKNLIISRKSEKIKEELKSEQRNRKCKEPQYVRSTRSENAEKISMKTDIPIQEIAEVSERNAVSAEINYVQTTKKGD